MTIRNLKNISNADITLNDFNGLTIQAGEIVDGLMFGEQALKESLSIVEALIANTLAINDGSYDYVHQRGVDLIRGTIDQLTKDGKRIVTTSDRPKNHYRYFTTCGDDMVNQIRGEGECLLFNVPPSSAQTIDAQFLDNTYLKDGSMIYLDAEMNSTLRVDVLVPANMPFPAKGKNGNFDYVNGEYVPNNTSTGTLWINETETLVHRFINHMAMFGSGRNRETIETTEPNFIPKEWIIRLTINNASPTNILRATITLGMYREQTF